MGATHGGGSTLDIWNSAAATYNWIDIATTGTDVGISGDDALSAPIPLGITYRFFGTVQPTVNVSTNGFLSFGGSATPGANTAIPDAAAPNSAFYVFWDDLIAYNVDSGDYIKYWHGVADTFVVSWRVHRVGGTAPIAFQAVLRANGMATFQYQSLDDRTSATIGVENGAGTYAQQLVFNGTPANIPAAPTSAYRFTETAGRPMAVSSLVAGPMGTSTNLLVSWTNPTTDTVGSPLTIDSCTVWEDGVFMARITGGASSWGKANSTLPFTHTYSVYAWKGGLRSAEATATANITAAAAYDYMEDFEISGGGWTVTAAADTTWQWGTPTLVGPPAAHSGSKLWGTNISGKYGNSACYQLELAPGMPVTSTGAGIAFWAWYKSEGTATSTADGANFRVFDRRRHELDGADAAGGAVRRHADEREQRLHRLSQADVERQHGGG